MVDQVNCSTKLRQGRQECGRVEPTPARRPGGPTFGCGQRLRCALQDTFPSRCDTRAGSCHRTVASCPRSAYLITVVCRIGGKLDSKFPALPQGTHAQWRGSKPARFLIFLTTGGGRVYALWIVCVVRASARWGRARHRAWEGDAGHVETGVRKSPLRAVSKRSLGVDPCPRDPGQSDEGAPARGSR